MVKQSDAHCVRDDKHVKQERKNKAPHHPHGDVCWMVDKFDHTIVSDQVTCANLVQTVDSTCRNSSLTIFTFNCKCEETSVQAN